MLKVLIRGWSLAAALWLLGSTSAVATPLTYLLDPAFSSATLRVTLDDGNATNVLTGMAAVVVPLDGSQAVFDPALGSNGALLSIVMTSGGPINLNLDQNVVALDTLSITNAMLTNDVGAIGLLSASNSFILDTLMSADVSGVFPDASNFGPVPVQSQTSGATGFLGLSGNQLTVGITGVNIATFAQTANPDPLAPAVVVKADFTFVGTLVPEPGTALLLGLGLVGLRLANPRTRNRPARRFGSR